MPLSSFLPGPPGNCKNHTYFVTITSTDAAVTALNVSSISATNGASVSTPAQNTKPLTFQVTTGSGTSSFDVSFRVGMDVQASTSPSTGARSWSYTVKVDY